MSQVLITGFLPFDGESMNPSEVLARDIASVKGWDCLILPVSYSRSVEHIRALKPSYSFIVHLGQAGGRSQIQVERFAVNWIEAKIADADGVSSAPRKIAEGYQDLLHTSWDLQEAPLKRAHMSVSLSAGAYVCNYLYYHTLKDYPQTKTAFIHVPYCREQTSSRNMSAPSLEMSVMKSHLLDYFHELKI